ncbi:MAG: hypothetical protein KDB90_06295 [Planctomycetes bacterium]|nr:hypothetical protein [Planctomycetota bacterium]
MSGTLALFLAKDDAFGFIFAFVIVAVVVGLIAWGAHNQKKIRENWAMFARKNGLQMQGSKTRPTIQGWLGPVYITLNTIVRGSGKNRTTYTQYHATINAPMPAGIVLYKEGFFSKVGKVFGGQDVQIGDPVIDNAFIIKAQDLLGVHNLLGLAPVKKALLYVVTRHPGLRVQDRQILIEHTGMTGDLGKIEGIFADMSYLAQTLDAGYQELAGTRPPEKVPAPKAKTRSAPAIKSRTEVRHEAQAAAAEILGAQLFAQTGTPQIRTSRPEDRAEKQKALSEMASALNQYGEKLERGEVVPETPDAATYGSAGKFSTDDAFKSPTLEDAFADPKLNDDVSNAAWSRNEPSKAFDSSSAWSSNEPSKAFDSSSAWSSNSPSSAFDSSPTDSDRGESGFGSFDAATDGKKATPTGAAAASLDELVAMLSDGSLMTSAREQIIADNSNTSWEVGLTVDRVDSSWGFELPDSLRDGKTVECKDAAGKNYAVRFPKARNAQIEKLRNGETLKVFGKLVAWDDLFKKATLDAD